MKNALTRSTTASIALLGLVACGQVQQEIVETRETTATSRNFGDAVLSSISNQIVDPTPVSTETPPEFDGDRSALAIQRYKTNTVRRPATVTTGGPLSGGGGGGGGAQ
ncbi:MAG TPA: hypothetical protein VJ924_07955 [Alphaproteobacteria bacterium]|nr:hypothetical protein [Alphaproteobacteria bacterium]